MIVMGGDDTYKARVDAKIDGLFALLTVCTWRIREDGYATAIWMSTLA